MLLKVVLLSSISFYKCYFENFLLLVRCEIRLLLQLQFRDASCIKYFVHGWWWNNSLISCSVMN